jgi:hypothetical protein
VNRINRIFSTLYFLVVVGFVGVVGWSVYQRYYTVQPLPQRPKAVSRVKRSHPLLALPEVAIPVPFSDRELDAQLYLKKKMDSLTKLTESHPELIENYIGPAFTDVVRLQKMRVTDPGYRELFNQLHADLNAIDDALDEDWT